MQKLLHLDPGLNRVIDRPPELTEGHKLGRALTRNTGADSRAESLKKQTRGQAPAQPGLEQQVLQDYEAGQGGRRTQKALHEAYFNRFVAAIQERVAILDELNDIVIKLKGKSALTGASREPTPLKQEEDMVGREAAGLNLQFVHSQFDKGHRHDLYNMHFRLQPLKDQWLQTVRMKSEEAMKVSGSSFKKLQAKILERDKVLSDLYARLEVSLQNLQNRLR
jgi:hypothetical protein